MDKIGSIAILFIIAYILYNENKEKDKMFKQFLKDQFDIQKAQLELQLETNNYLSKLEEICRTKK